MGAKCGNENVIADLAWHVYKRLTELTRWSGCLSVGVGCKVDWSHDEEFIRCTEGRCTAGMNSGCLVRNSKASVSFCHRNLSVSEFILFCVWKEAVFQMKVTGWIPAVCALELLRWVWAFFWGFWTTVSLVLCCGSLSPNDYCLGEKWMPHDATSPIVRLLDFIS